MLRFYEDLTVGEIAGHLGVSDGAVKRYLSDGVRTLQATLGAVREADVTIELVEEAGR